MRHVESRVICFLGASSIRESQISGGSELEMNSAHGIFPVPGSVASLEMTGHYLSNPSLKVGMMEVQSLLTEVFQMVYVDSGVAEYREARVDDAHFERNEAGDEQVSCGLEKSGKAGCRPLK